jgi:molybdate transport system regulatory protein
VANISLRIDFGKGAETRVGPGKIALLEAIVRQRSISAAARELGMSYRRAWLLVDAMNRLFHSPVVTTATGGQQGGGAELTKTGIEVLATYRAIETAATQAGLGGLRTLSALVSGSSPPTVRRKPVAKSRTGKTRVRS